VSKLQWLVAALVALAFVVALAACGGAGGSTEPISVVKTDSGQVSFEGTIHPILLDHCGKRCHNEEAEGGFQVTTYESVLAGGKRGNTIVAGDPDGSQLIGSVTKTKAPHMPPRIFPALTEDRIEALRSWIAEGAENN
jgi:hypothetical protein